MAAAPAPYQPPFELDHDGHNDEDDDATEAVASEPRRKGWVARMDDRVEASCIGRYFQLKERGARCSVELIGGLASYLTGLCVKSVWPR